MARRRGQRAELWLGLLVIVSAVILTWGYFWLTGQPIGERGYTVTIILKNAEGLERGDRVRASGVEVGAVRSVRLEGPDRVVIRLWLQRSFQLPRDSRALNQSAGVFGDRLIELRPGVSDVLAVDGDTLQTQTTASLTGLAGTIGEKAEAVLTQVEKLLADTAIDDMHGTVSALQGTVIQLEQLIRENGDEFAALSRSVRRTADTLRETIDGAEIDETLASLESTATTLEETAEELKASAESLRSIAEKIDRGEGTLGRLVNDPSVYEELQSALRSVSSLTQDIRENPGRYLKLAIF